MIQHREAPFCGLMLIHFTIIIDQGKSNRAEIVTDRLIGKVTPYEVPRGIGDTL